jgi:hypothetical protein
MIVATSATQILAIDHAKYKRIAGAKPVFAQLAVAVACCRSAPG